jgi:arginase
VGDRDEPPDELIILGVPIDSVGVAGPGDPPAGCELMPGALRSAGLVAAIGAADAGDMDVRIVGRERDSETGMFGWPSVAALTTAVRGRVASVVADGKVPVLIGGCCTMVPGAVAGARDILGPLGLAYVDGHLDLYDAATSPTGEAADMPISVVAGHGPALWVEHVGAPLIAPGRLALLGPADRAEAATMRSRMPEDLGIPVEQAPLALRSVGLAAAGTAAASRVGNPYWVHFDVDVLDQREFPATDYPNASGLSLAEARQLLRPLTRSAGMVGFSVGCYNPQRDPGGDCARSLTQLLASLLGSDSRAADHAE